MATRVLDDLAGAEASYKKHEGTAYIELLLSAHYATVATFVPTDVDARIRHHAWQAMTDPQEVARAVEVVDRVATWDVHPVSARVFDSKAHGTLSGHDGEWFSVRAGALARAAQLGAVDLAEAIAKRIDGELDREEAIFREALEHDKGAAGSADVLRIATILAHNLGDLSRVAAEWPKNEFLQTIRDRYKRLGHGDAAVPRPLFTTAGTINKAIMAHENHRFLPLRKPRGLRASRSLLLPIGPWLDTWGETIAKSELLEQRDRAEVLEALLEVHARDATQEGCLRAIAGLHRATRGGIEIYVPDLPARMRKDALRGRVRDALDVTVDHFAARIDRRYRAERGER